MKRQSSFFPSSDIKNSVSDLKAAINLKLSSVITKLADYSLSEDAKITPMSLQDLQQIQSENQFIAQNADKSTLSTHALTLLSFLALSQNSCNKESITVIYQHFKAQCPSDLIKKAHSQLEELNLSASNSLTGGMKQLI